MKQRSSVFQALDKRYSVDFSLKGVSFGLGSRSILLNKQGRDSPSPLKYYPVKAESPYKGVSFKGYSSDLNVIKRLKSLPGPGSYDPYEPLGVSAVKYTLKSRFIGKSQNSTPAPNRYLPNYDRTKTQSPAYSFGLKKMR